HPLGRRDPVHAELGAQRLGDRAGDLDLEAGLLLVLTGERQVRRIRAQPDPSNLAAPARRRRQEDGGREAEDSHSLSPNTTTRSLQFIFRAWDHLGSLPNQTWRRSVPPAATATYC